MGIEEIRLPKAVYSESIIRRGIEGYQKICQISCRPDEDTHVCAISHSLADLELTTHEFMNYLIEIANSGGTR